MKKKTLIVRRRGTDEEIHRVDVTGKEQPTIEKIMLSMLRNMAEDYYIDDSEA
jgi:hypothetical protein